MKILVYTPYKVGSTKLSEAFRRSDFIIKGCYRENHFLEHDENFWQYDNYLLKAHACDLKRLLTDNKKFDYLFTIVRKPADLFLSAFFQDITNEAYPYFYGTKQEVLSGEKSHILQHFLKFDYSKLKNLSINWNFNEIEKASKVNLWEEPFDKNLGYSVIKSKTDSFRKVILLTMETLRDLDKCKHLFLSLGLKVYFDALEVNSAQDKWYSSLYKEIKADLPSIYQDQYDHINKKVQEKFLR